MKLLFKLFHKSTVILLLLYFYIQVINSKMYIKVHPNILSEKTVTILPEFLIHTFFWMIIIFVIISFYMDRVFIQILYFFVASFVFSTAFVVTANMLQLNAQTDFIMTTIYHPVPLDFKIQYLKNQICSLIALNNFEQNKDMLTLLAKKIPIYFKEDSIKNLNCEGLNLYAQEIVLDTFKELKFKHSIRNNIIVWFFITCYGFPGLLQQGLFLNPIIGALKNLVFTITNYISN